MKIERLRANRAAGRIRHVRADHAFRSDAHQKLGYAPFRHDRPLRAPIHHHFEMLGIPDNKIVMGFWILAILSAMAGLATLKLR